MDPDERLRVCLEREVELQAVRLELRDWPGRAGPLVHLPDPFSPTSDLEFVDALARAFAPTFRVLSITPRGYQPYQVQVADVLGVLDQFGFSEPVLIGERFGCTTALLLAAWWPNRIGRLVLVDARYEPLPFDQRAAGAVDASSAGVAARALRDCPPDWNSLRASVTCPILTLAWDASAVGPMQAFLLG